MKASCSPGPRRSSASTWRASTRDALVAFGGERAVRADAQACRVVHRRDARRERAFASKVNDCRSYAELDELLGGVSSTSSLRGRRRRDRIRPTRGSASSSVPEHARRTSTCTCRSARRSARTATSLPCAGADDDFVEVGVRRHPHADHHAGDGRDSTAWSRPSTSVVARRRSTPAEVLRTARLTSRTCWYVASQRRDHRRGESRLARPRASQWLSRSTG